MLSDKRNTEYIDGKPVVLILVVMEDALWLLKPAFLIRFSDVLILVVMEDALWHFFLYPSSL